MVTIRELYASGLPDRSTDPEIVESFLRAGQKAVAELALPTCAAGSLNFAKPPRPFLGPSQDTTPPARLVESQYEAVKEARQRASEHLRMAVCKRAHAQRAASSRGRETRSAMSGTTDDMRIPAVFPFPEPIPRGPPSRELSRRSTMSSRADSRTASRMSAGGMTSRAESLFSPSPSRLDRSITPGSPDYVPAVFPFPEPIPREAPERLSPRDTSFGGFRSGASSSSSARPSSRKAGGQDVSELSTRPGSEASRGASRMSVRFGGLPEDEETQERSKSPDRDRRRMPRCVVYDDDSMEVDENRIRANQWITECAPKSFVMLEQERPLWMQTKLFAQRQRKHRDDAFKNMPTMPFDLWLEMKQTLRASAANRELEARAAKKLQDENAEKGDVRAKYARHKTDGDRLLEMELRAAEKREEVEMRNFYKQLASVRRMEYKYGREIRTLKQDALGMLA